MHRLNGGIAVAACALMIALGVPSLAAIGGAAVLYGVLDYAGE